MFKMNFSRGRMRRKWGFNAREVKNEEGERDKNRQRDK